GYEKMRAGGLKRSAPCADEPRRPSLLASRDMRNEAGGLKRSRRVLMNHVSVLAGLGYEKDEAGGLKRSRAHCADVVATFGLEPKHGEGDGAAQHMDLDWQQLPIGAGIFLVSLGGHASLPALYREMRQPEQFDAVMDVSFGLMAAIYAVIGGTGYAYFGEATEVLITSNLWSAWSEHDWGSYVSKCITGLVAFTSYSTIGPCVMLLAPTEPSRAEADEPTLGTCNRPGWCKAFITTMMRTAVFILLQTGCTFISYGTPHIKRK
ncbi:hypothetical protein CYMTET_17399, partial [Cymbomonas tetramitiformis]